MDEKLLASGVEPKVLLSTNVNPKLVGALEVKTQTLMWTMMILLSTLSHLNSLRFHLFVEKSLNKLQMDTRELSMETPHFSVQTKIITKETSWEGEGQSDHHY